jgi:hypothetical protein
VSSLRSGVDPMDEAILSFAKGNWMAFLG